MNVRLHPISFVFEVKNSLLVSKLKLKCHENKNLG